MLTFAREFVTACGGVPAQLTQCVTRAWRTLVDIAGAAAVERAPVHRIAVPGLYAVCSVAFAVLSPLIIALLRTLHTDRRLNGRERKALDGLGGLDQLRVVDHPHSVLRVFFAGTHACAIGDTVYLFDAGSMTAPITRHEAFHILQYRREGGFAPFLGLYFAFTIYDLLATFSTSAAYARNPLEREARGCEDVRVWRAAMAAIDDIS